MKLKLFTFVLLSVCSAYALQMGDIQDTTPVAITGTEYAGNVSLVSLGKAQAIADSLSEGAALKMYHYGNPTQEMTPDEAFGFDPTTGTITSYDDNIGGVNVVVPYEIDGVAVTGLGSFAFSSSLSPNVGDLIETVITPMSINSIGTGTFVNCTNLVSVSLRGVTFESTNEVVSAFYNTSKLLSVSLESAVRIPDALFNTPPDVSSVESVSAPLAVSVGDNAFRFCSSLTNVYIPSVVDVGKAAFSGCFALEFLSLPSVLTLPEDYGVFSVSGVKVIYLNSNKPSGYNLGIDITNVVLNSTATGWGDTFGGPVVRPPVYADEFYLRGTAVSTLLGGGAPEWIVRSGLTGTVSFENTSNRPQAWSGTGTLTVLEFTGLQSPTPVYWTLQGFDSITLPSSVHFVGGGSWQTNMVNHFSVWLVGDEVMMSVLTATSIEE